MTKEERLNYEHTLNLLNYHLILKLDYGEKVKGFSNFVTVELASIMLKHKIKLNEKGIDKALELLDQKNKTKKAQENLSKWVK